MSVSGLSPASSTYPSIVNRSREAGASPASSGSQTQNGNAVQLTQEAAAQLAQLKQRDREVRQHEQAHMAAAGALATSGASFTYQKGPDGVNYAVGGEVGIDSSPGRTPEETIRRAQTVRAAALAPADPSGQDRAVSAQATQMELQAKVELAQEPTADSPQDKTISRVQSEVNSYYASAEPPSHAVSTYA